MAVKFKYTGSGMSIIEYDEEGRCIANVKVTELIHMYKTGDAGIFRFQEPLPNIEEIIKKVLFGPCICSPTLVPDKYVDLVNRMGGHIGNHASWLDCVILHILRYQMSYIESFNPFNR